MRMTPEQIELLEHPERCGEFADLARSVSDLSGPDAWNQELLEQRLIPVTHLVPQLLVLAVQAGLIGPTDGT